MSLWISCVPDSIYIRLSNQSKQTDVPRLNRLRMCGTFALVPPPQKKVVKGHLALIADTSKQFNSPIFTTYTYSILNTSGVRKRLN